MVDRIGNCRILGEIGSGGMAVIYKAIQEPLGREVAIKALKPSIAIDSQFAARFEREARFMASLQHENIIHVYDFVKERSGMYIIIEYVQGIDLFALLERAHHLPIDVAAIIALQVARALDYAHFRGLIHRDIKPANIIISFKGEVKLMDFGVARDETRGRDLTEAGAGVGTPSYMSPEQILDDKLDFRSDIFSLGVVLYQMLTGNKPFIEDEGRSVMQKIRLDPYANPRKVIAGIPIRMERMLRRCLEKLPSSRYPTAQALIDDLTEFLAARVPMNYNARLVTYLRDLGMIGGIEAERVLSVSAARGSRGRQSEASFVRGSLVTFSLFFFLVLLCGSSLQVCSGRLSEKKGSETSPREMPVMPHNAGYLQVVVEPWADLFVDGQMIVTTPSSRPIPLSPGIHYLSFKNPYFVEETAEVTIQTGKTVFLERQLKSKPQTTRHSDKGELHD
jgi:eukaryotic-like serine/threonine-protein kinase